MFDFKTLSDPAVVLQLVNDCLGCCTCCMKSYGVYALAAIPAFWLTYYVGWNVVMYLLGPVDLKKKYNAEWALVTGAGTGIGKSLSHSLAQQGLNVVLVSLPDKHLDATTKELQEEFPDQEFRAVKAVFDHKTDYMPAIIDATDDIDVQIVFNNAGYIVTGEYQ